MSFQNLLNPENAEQLAKIEEKLRRKPISAKRVYELQAVRKEIAALKSKVKQLETHEGIEESAIIDQLDLEVKPGPGCPALVVKTDTRRNVSWKEVFIKFTSHRTAEAVLADTEPDEYRSLVIGNGREVS